MNLDQLKATLKKFRLSPNFTYGQNFLVDTKVFLDILEAAELRKEDCVLEIGPGIGSLTRLLAAESGMVLGVEKDSKFRPLLEDVRKDCNNFRYEIADVLKYDYQKIFREQGCASYKVVANIPYYITGKILRMLLAAENKPSLVVLLTQKEVARNVVAGPGDLSILAISVQIYGKPEIARVVHAGSFYPAPKVDSAILKIKPYEKMPFDIPDERKFFRAVKACFAGKRKQIHNTLASNLHLPKSEVSGALESLGVDPAARPQDLEIGQWVELSKKFFN